MRRGVSSASQQIFDSATSAPATIAASGNGFAFANGTNFPLLPNQSVRIFNVSAQVEVDAPNVLIANAMSIFVAFLDSQGNLINLPELLLATATWPNDTFINGDIVGACVSATGDPLVELVSNLLLTNIAIAGGAGIAAISIQADIDVTNSDAVNTHTVTVELAALLSFQPRD